ncbi:MAG: hypothetical protein AB7G17_05500 [Phycisphaerales bacterium]
MRTTRTILTCLIGAGAALTGAGALSGCDYVAAATYLVEGPPKVDAAYELDAKRKTVLLIDDRGNALPRRSLRRVIGEEAEQTMLSGKALKADLTIPSSSTQAVMTQERRESPRSVVDIGREVGADVIIYVEMSTFSLSRDGATASPLVTGSVKVFDVTANTRLWPETPQGFPLTYAPATRSATMPGSLAERMQQEDAVAKMFGRAVGQLFFQHERSESAQYSKQ